MPKKPPKNSYFFFMLDFKKREESQGRRFSSMEEVASLCSESWKMLTKAQKEPYEARAKQAKLQGKTQGERYTSQGRALSDVRREEEELKRKKEFKQQTIVKIIDEAVQNKKLDKTSFYIVSFNYFYKEVGKNMYYPCELGLVRFSIKGGITKKFHKLINPGQLPLGSRFTVEDHANKTHKLPVPPKAFGDDDYTDILDQMCEFFIQEPTTRSNKFPVFVMEEEMDMVEAIFDEMCRTVEFEVDNFQFLPLTYFFHKLRGAVDKVFLGEDSMFTFAIAMSHLERDNYQYYAGNGCKFHEKDDVNIHCALSRPTRWAYYIIDQTIGIIGGKKKVGFHFPKECVIEDEPQYDEDSDDDDDDAKCLKKEESDEEGNTDYDHYADSDDFKVIKNEFSDTEGSTSRSNVQQMKGQRNRRDSDTATTISTLSSAVKRGNVEGEHFHCQEDDDFETNSIATSFDDSAMLVNPFSPANYPSVLASIQKDRQNYASSSSGSETGRILTYKDRDYDRKRDTYRALGSSTSADQQRSTSTDIKFDREKYLREKYEKLKAELAFLDKKKIIDYKHKNIDDFSSSSKRRRTDT